MIDLRQRLSVLNQLEAPDMRADIERRAAELLNSSPEPSLVTAQVSPWWRGPLIAAGTAAVILVMVAAAAMVLRADPSEITDTMVSPTPITSTTTPGVTTPSMSTVPTTVSTVTAVIPSLGEGWETVLSGYPDDPSTRPNGVSITEAGYYVSSWSGDWYLMTFDGVEPIPIESIPAGSPDIPAHGFVTGGPGVVAWVNVGPESRTEAQLWVSSDGINFERVAESDLLVGCGGVSDCRGTQIYAAAASPTGRVVALGYDPLVWKPECDCFELDPVALVSDDGYEWTRQPLDLLSVLPAEWQGAADIRSPLVYVEGRWLTYGTHYYNNGYTTDTALFASEDGIDWQLIDTGDLFEETYLTGIAANDRGVVAITREDAYWSADGYEWTRTGVTGGDDAHKVAAYDNGYAVVSAPRVPDGAPIDTIWYSADGTTWSPMPLQLEEPTHWNTIVGDGPNLIAVGVAETNLAGLWRWSG
jgi:hypothetical protein